MCFSTTSDGPSSRRGWSAVLHRQVVDGIRLTSADDVSRAGSGESQNLFHQCSETVGFGLD